MACDTFVRGGVCLSNGLICEKNKAKSASMKFSSPPVVRRGDDEVCSKGRDGRTRVVPPTTASFRSLHTLTNLSKGTSDLNQNGAQKNHFLVQYLKPFTIARLSKGPT